MDARTPTIIVVDDDPALRGALKFSFELDGYSVETFASAEALLAAPKLPDVGCLVLDVRLPGADGLALLGSLRERRVNLPAVLITTQPPAALRLAAAQAGVPIVEKPLMNDALLDQVRGALARA